MARTGRRPAAAARPSTRTAILASARKAFAEHGYEGATIRGIAAGAGVDPALVHHYFGTKDDLLVEAIRLPASVGELITRIAVEEPSRAGEAIAEAYANVWEDPESRQVVLAMLRAAVTNEHAERVLRELITKHILGPAAKALGKPDAELRAALAGSQLIGLAFARYVVKIEPLANADIKTLVAAIAPTIHRYLTADL